MNERTKANYDLIFRTTHQDFKSDPGQKPRSILVLRAGGTTSVPLELLTDAEFEGKLKYAMGCELRRHERRATASSRSAGVNGF